MRVRAIAVAAEESNAVGTVELECTPHALVVTYLGVGPFQEGYAPAALTRGTRVSAPWTAVVSARAAGPYVFLQLSPEVTPHHRLALTSFSSGHSVDHRELYRQRLILRIATLGGAAVAAALASLALTAFAGRFAAPAALAVAVLAAMTIVAVGLTADRRLALGGIEGEAARTAFIATLASYFPALARGGATPEQVKPVKLPDVHGLLPRGVFAVAAVLTAALLASLLIGRWVVDPKPARDGAVSADAEWRSLAPAEPQQPATDPPAIAAAAPAPNPEPRVPRAPAASSAAPRETAAAGELALGAPCACTRADSPLWEQPIPRLSILVIETSLEQRGSKRRLLAEIAIVNNSDEAMRELSLNVQFYSRDKPSAPRELGPTRVLYFEGPLSPGQAIKWSTEANGTELEVQNPVTGNIGPGGDGAAPIERFVELLDANHRPVRMHAAMMLAYLGDARARDAALKLRDALRDSEAPYLNRLLETLGDTRVCQVGIRGSGNDRRVNACVFNASKQTRQNLGFKLRALGSRVSHSYPVAPPPEVTGTFLWRLSGELAAGAGKAVSAELPPELATGDAAVFEGVAGRADLIR